MKMLYLTFKSIIKNKYGKCSLVLMVIVGLHFHVYILFPGKHQSSRGSQYDTSFAVRCQTWTKGVKSTDNQLTLHHSTNQSF